MRLDNFRRDRGRRAGDMRRMADGWAASAGRGDSKAGPAAREGFTPAQILTLGYPDRIAKARGAPGQFLLAAGRGAQVDATDALARSSYLVVAEMQGKAAATRILLAARASEAEIIAIARDRIAERDELSFDTEARAVRARRVRRLDAIELASEPLRVAAGPETEAALADGVARLGISKLPWTKAQLQLRERTGFLRGALGEDWPDLTDDGAGRFRALSGCCRFSPARRGSRTSAPMIWTGARRAHPVGFEAPPRG